MKSIRQVGQLPVRETVLPCCAIRSHCDKSSPGFRPVAAWPSHLQMQTVARVKVMPVTVARPQQIFTAFRFLSQYQNKLIYKIILFVNRRFTANYEICPCHPIAGVSSFLPTVPQSTNGVVEFRHQHVRRRVFYAASKTVGKLPQVSATT